MIDAVLMPTDKSDGTKNRARHVYMFILRRILFIFIYFTLFSPENQVIRTVFKITREDFIFYENCIDFIFFDILFLILLIWFHGHNN